MEDNLSEPGTEIVLLDEEVQYVDIRSNRTSAASDVSDRPVDLPIRAKDANKEWKSTAADASPSPNDLDELNRVLLSPAQNTISATSEKEHRSDSRVLPQEGASTASRDKSPSQSNGVVSPPSSEKDILTKSREFSLIAHDQSNNAQNVTNTQAVLAKDERSQGQAVRSRSDDIDIKSPDKPCGLKTPEMSSSPMDVDSLSSSYDKMAEGFSPGDKAVAMTPDNVSMEELSDHDLSKNSDSKLGQRSRASKASTDSIGSSGDELGHGKMDISFHSDKDVLEEEIVFMDTTSKSKSSSVDSLDKGPMAPKNPKLEEQEEENLVKAQIGTANTELLEPVSVKTPESAAAETRKEMSSGKSASLSPNNAPSATNGLVSPASTESMKSPAADNLNESSSSEKSSADSSFVMRSATELDTRSLPVPKRKRSVKDLLSQFETLSQSPPKELQGQGQSPPSQGALLPEVGEAASKSKPAVFQKPKVVHLKTLSPSAQQEASDFSKVQTQSFQSKAPTKTTPENITTTITAKKPDVVVIASTPVSTKTRDKTPPAVKPVETKERPIPEERVIANGQSLMSKSLDQSMLLKTLDTSNTSELSVDTSCDVMSRSMEMTPSELNKDRPAKPAKKLGHSPSFKERLRMYESQREGKIQKQQQPQQQQQQQVVGKQQQATNDLNVSSRSERASSEESVGSVRNLSKMFERQNSNRSDGFF